MENFHSYHERVNPKQPLFIPECVISRARSASVALTSKSVHRFQSGAFDPWGPNAPGYGKCAELLNPQFQASLGRTFCRWPDTYEREQSVFFLNNWAANVKMINLYVSRLVQSTWRQLKRIADDVRGDESRISGFPRRVHQL